MPLKDDVIEGVSVCLYYLHCEFDYSGQLDSVNPYTTPGLAAGLARLAQEQIEDPQHPYPEQARHYAKMWTEVASATWTTSCVQLVESLPDYSGFLVVPSKRTNIRDGLRTAARSRQGSLEIDCRRDTEIRFGSATVDAIESALKVTIPPDLDAGRPILILDDWFGKKNTLRAVVRTLVRNLEKQDLRLLAAAPGVSGKAIGRASPMKGG